jgi:hypothetical protein
VIALATGISGERVPPREIWRLIWPLAPAAIAISWAAIGILS